MNSKAKTFVTAGAFAALVATSAFAAPQYDNGRYDRNNRGQDQQQQSDRGYNRGDNRGSRDNRQADSSRGYRDNQRINASREGNGYRVQLDRGRDSYFVPESRLGGHGLRAGNGGVLQGRIERVDDRDGFARLDTDGRHVQVRLGEQVRQLRRGDWVTVEGRWDRGNVFDAYRIDGVR